MRVSRRTMAAGAGALVSALLLAGCSAIGDRVVETALERVEGVDGVDIDRSSGNVTISGSDGDGGFSMDTSEDGTVVIETEDGTFTTRQDADIPPEIREAFELPAGFQAAVVQEGLQEDKRMLSVQGTVDGTFADVREYVGAALEAAGWQDVQDFQMGSDTSGMSGFLGTRGENSINVSVFGEEGDELMLQIMYLEPVS